MNQLLAEVIEAHGGLERWRSLDKAEATVVTGGGLFGLKGLTPEPDPREATVWLREQRSSMLTGGAPGERAVFTPGRTAIEKPDGTVVAERLSPTDLFAGHQMNTPWDALHQAYFQGEALWTAVMTPFLLTFEGVRVEEVDPWPEEPGPWRVLRAWFPGTIQTHSSMQDFFFDDNRLLRRHDFHLNLAGGFPAAQLTTQHVNVGGITLPTRRRAYARGPDCQPIMDLMMVAIDLTDLRFT
jgi:hypothetical protein